ncbi:hypothetical protein [Kineococcus rhizosphaerae]|uniref:Tetratricopeptide repeat protein n=1 Tax=Kineococcus rhizosphaerae TaxID=559628 RepID=A0A2T0RBH5_9ACTN|nr:hypothetical protein [Kineococcus rhizosphaerae]PRY18518.1 hypothetical protein CLV37_101763 [Kineococcus rhizosphaerae]
MRTKVVVAVSVAALLFYFVFLGRLGAALIGTGNWAGIALGIALFLLPLVGLWAVARELMFGVATERLGRELAARGELPVDDLDRTAAGRIDRAAGAAAWERARAEVEDAPDDAGAWYRLAMAYDAAGDRRRGRAAARHAVRLHRR